MTIEQVAKKKIPAALNLKVLTKDNGVTKDIIKEVLACFKSSKDQLENFAPFLKGKNIQETCSNIWHFWKKNIRYKVDEDGVQWVKTPAAFFSSGFGDCKSFSVAVACTLYCLGIKSKFRFTSYAGNKTQPTHVYVVATDEQGKEIFIDCVWTAFNAQKPFTKNWDYNNMTKIFRLSGIDEEVAYYPAKKYSIGELNIDPNDPGTTEAELSIALDLQKLELDQKANRAKHKIGSPYDNAYQVQIEGHKAALHQIGLFRSKKKRLAIAIKKNKGKKGVNKRQAKLLRKAGIAVTKVKDGLLKRIGKGITKVLKTPIRLLAKSKLPKSAPFFLYLYITDPKVIAAMPQIVRQKRDKALYYKDVMVKKLQMKESNFNKIIQNGIQSSFGQPAEQVIAKWMADAHFKIGFLSAILSEAGGMLKGLLGQMGENFANDVEQFSPAPEDWGVITADPSTAENMAAQQQQSYSSSVQPNGNGGYSYANSSYGDGDEWNETDGAPGNSEFDNSWKQLPNGQWKNTNTGEVQDTKPFNASEDLDDVEIRSQKTQAAGGSTMWLVAALGIGLLMSQKK